MIALLDHAKAAQARAEFKGVRWAERPVVTIGFFDLLHLGHLQILADLAAWARRVGGAPVVITFDRHPQEVLTGRPPVAIASLTQRLVLLARAGVEASLVLRFDRELAGWAPEEFVGSVLQEALGSRELLMGFDSAFGRARAGTFESLKARERELGLDVRRAEPLIEEGVRISSTRVREAVRAGDFPRLEALLGRPFSVISEVVAGERRGRRLGFPTANLILPAHALPPRGVYFARAAVLEHPRRAETYLQVSPERGSPLPAVVNIGTRPTFDSGSSSQVLEAHLLGFEGEIYGKLLEVELLKRHRDEMRFPGPEELMDQIRKDIEARRAFP